MPRCTGPSCGRREPQRRDALANRKALLEAAGRVFAEQGYRNASVREICRLAGVNIGAINRHFGSKDALYETVLVAAGRALLERETVPRLEDFGDPREALRAWMHFHLRLMLLHKRQDPIAGQLLTKEIRDPTPALDQYAAMVVAPVRAELARIVAGVLGEPAETPRVQTATTFTMGTCAFQGVGAPMLERVGQPTPSTEGEVAARLEQLYPMVLAGILQTPPG